MDPNRKALLTMQQSLQCQWLYHREEIAISNLVDLLHLPYEKYQRIVAQRMQKQMLVYPRTKPIVWLARLSCRIQSDTLGKLE